ncbi:MAG: hypothetical protein M1368_01140, partial [Thaumarchaeota archaeon]|nr:hypothetical protein [Nitrososphaerota archaeon]
MGHIKLGGQKWDGLEFRADLLSIVPSRTAGIFIGGFVNEQLHPTNNNRQEARIISDIFSSLEEERRNIIFLY